jgi:hypothetical protein
VEKPGIRRVREAGNSRTGDRPLNETFNSEFLKKTNHINLLMADTIITMAMLSGCILRNTIAYSTLNTRCDLLTLKVDRAFREIEDLRSKLTGAKAEISFTRREMRAIREDVGCLKRIVLEAQPDYRMEEEVEKRTSLSDEVIYVNRPDSGLGLYPALPEMMAVLRELTDKDDEVVL